ncbi:MAG: GDSL-type esterase/lipase family protein [Ktedonobacterales bacterium]
MNPAQSLPARLPSTGPATTRRVPRLTLAVFVALVAALTLVGCGSGATARRSTPQATATARPSFEYVALGASDALGIGATDPNTQGYIPIIISRLPKTAGALNLGVSGISLHDALTQELPQAIQAQPNLVTVWLVGNDFKDCVSLTKYGADLDSLLTQLQTKTHAQVFVANTPDMSALPAFQGGSIIPLGPCFTTMSLADIRALARQWNTVIDPIVTKHGDTLVNLFVSALSSQPDLISPADGFHPSSKGYALLADLFWAQITAHHAAPGT